MPPAPRIRPPARPYKSKSTSFSPAEYFKIETVQGERDNEANGARLTHTRQSRVGQADECFGDRVMSKGEHKFVFTICSSHSGSGTGFILGVAAVSDGSIYARKKYGVRVSDGRCITYPDGGGALQRGRQQKV